ncbi:hypothetical protein ABIA32_006716 [Streptacidiphilus sp. MAP12-20]|uniref:hypothetical protein n=1 Tax=Streptacidiphilus sp. MAP12-20 TaxID=3156299 RepID=UPI003519D61F
MNTARAAALGTLFLTVAGIAAASPASATTTTAEQRPGAALQPPAVAPAVAGLTGAVPYVVRPAKDFRLDPLANSAADPLNNGVALQPDSPHAAPVSTLPVTSPLSGGGGLSSLPLVGSAAGLLPG